MNCENKDPSRINFVNKNPRGKVKTFLVPIGYY